MNSSEAVRQMAESRWPEPVCRRRVTISELAVGIGLVEHVEQLGAPQNRSTVETNTRVAKRLMFAARAKGAFRATDAAVTSTNTDGRLTSLDQLPSENCCGACLLCTDSADCVHGADPSHLVMGRDCALMPCQSSTRPAVLSGTVNRAWRAGRGRCRPGRSLGSCRQTETARR
jgi:hypothetical protein